MKPLVSRGKITGYAQEALAPGGEDVTGQREKHKRTHVVLEAEVGPQRPVLRPRASMQAAPVQLREPRTKRVRLGRTGDCEAALTRM